MNKKTISVIGIGRLGLPFALSLERSGYDVIGCDIREDYVKDLRRKMVDTPEPLVEKYLRDATDFFATTDAEYAVKHSDITFVIVKTPSKPNGRYDHSQIESVVDDIRSVEKGSNKLVIMSTVMPGYTDDLDSRLENYDIFYNPEFIAQGRIVEDQENPDMVLVGTPDGSADHDLSEIYHEMTDNNPPISFMPRLSSEITKLTLNCFCTTKISFANMVGDLVKEVGQDPHAVLEAIGHDDRVGHEYLGYGFGYGGPCFPRDNRAIATFGNDHGHDMKISIATDEINEQHLDFQVKEFLENHDKDEKVVFPGEHVDYDGDGVEVCSVTYKPGVAILRESQQLEFAKRLAGEGYDVEVHDDKRTIENLKDRGLGEIFKLKIE